MISSQSAYLSIASFSQKKNKTLNMQFLISNKMHKFYLLYFSMDMIIIPEKQIQKKKKKETTNSQFYLVLSRVEIRTYATIEIERLLGILSSLHASA